MTATPPPLLTTLPGPPTTPVLGWRGNAVRFLLDPVGYMARLPATRGLVAFAAGGTPKVLLPGSTGGGSIFALGAEANQTVLSDMASFHSRPIPGPPESPAFARLTSGLFNMNLGQHRAQRRLMQPALHRQRVAGYHAEMVKRTVATLDGWRVGDQRDMLGELTRLSMAISTACLFGAEADEATGELGAAILEIIALSMSPFATLPAALPFTPRRRLVARSAEVEAALRALVAEKRASPDATDVLADLVRARDEDGAVLSDDELIGQTFLLFFAGHDTTRSALAWTLLLLAQHPDVLGALHDELSSVLRGDPPTLAQLGQLPLLDGVIKESLRLFPPVPWTLRESVAEVELCGASLPAETEVMLSYYLSHRDPEHFPDPTRFVPERWAGAAPPPFAYVPFGGGPRTCVGAAFATAELSVVLSTLLQRFHPVFPAGARVDRRTRIMMTPGTSMPMVLGPVGARGPVQRLAGNVAEMVVLPG